MTTPELIYQILDSVEGFITTKELATRLGVNDERLLRASGEDVGELEKAKAFIYRKYRRLMVTNYKGVRIFDNPKEALNWTSKKKKRLISESRSIRKEELRANHLMNEAQERLAL
jgi:hypothetical protein